MKNSPIRYINLPKIPEELIANLSRDYTTYHGEDLYQWDNYKRTNIMGSPIAKLCDENVIPDTTWGFQFIDGDLAPHTDLTLVKISYIFETGGDNVLTEFYDGKTHEKVQSMNIEPHRWHILQVSEPHAVRGIEPGKIRFSISGRIFYENEKFFL